MNGKRCKLGFSMAEALVTMLVVALLVAASVPVFTKKHRTIDANTQHGKWACKYINGELHSARAENIDDDLPTDNKEWQKDCVFPGTGKNVKYLYVEVYGAGGGGSEAKVTPWTNVNKHIKFGEPVPVDSVYNVYIKGSDAGTPQSWDVTNPYYTTNHLGNLGSFYDEKYYRAETVYCETCFSSGNCCGKSHHRRWDPTGCRRSYSCNCHESCYYDDDDDDDDDDNDNDHYYRPSKPDKDYGTGDYTPPPSTSNPSNGGDDAIYRFLPIKSGVLTGGAVNLNWFNKYKNGKVTGGAYTCHTTCSTCYEVYGCYVYSHSTSQPCYCSFNHGQLPKAEGGAASNAVEGYLEMVQGERVDKIALGTYKAYPDTMVNGYPVSGGVDAEGYKYVYVNASTSTGGVAWQEKILAQLTGGTAGRLGTTGSNCCYNCGHRDPFPNSAGGRPHCATNGKPGKVTNLASGFSQKGTSVSAKPEGLYVDIDKFEYKVGCHGQAGGMTASLLPVANSRNFKFQVGKGGPQKDGNPNGEDTFFSWVTATGGKGAFKGCTSDTTDVNKAKVANNGQRLNALGLKGLSDGGLAGTVTIHETECDGGPCRDYKIPRQQDQAPNNRWTVEEPGKGLPGMIVVSW